MSAASARVARARRDFEANGHACRPAITISRGNIAAYPYARSKAPLIHGTMKSCTAVRVTRAAALLVSATLIAWAHPTAARQDASTNPGMKSCTLLGCGPDSLVIYLSAVDERNPTSIPDMSLRVDGTPIECRAVRPPNDLESPQCDDPRVRLSIEPRIKCADNGLCVRAAGKTAVRIYVIGTPEKVEITLRGRSSERAAFTPRYELHIPNGPDCPPACRYATAQWTANHPW